ncbi:site-specific DNA-methyltransferase [Saccharicrinis sp. GN24d3]|uniref:site-specific DNA-methyltransferase n=1 Tax=Saccharicrinis sp. GN24d3 TaxID=3458416 RepID=UPI00403528EF
MAKKYTGSLTLEWYNKQKSIINLDENSIKSSDDVPAPAINWINKDDALFYELSEEDGKGKKPYWVDRNDIRVKEARPLIFQKAYRAVAKDKVGTIPGTDTEFEIKEISKEGETKDINNLLIKGDNLLALNSLKKHFDKLPDNEKVKCIYIDPPYNTGSAFEFYEDNLEHSEWLTLMRDRLVILKECLASDGFIFVQMDNREVFRLKLLLDEVFGAENFINDIVWKRRGGSANPSNRLNNVIDYILWYRNSEASTFNQIFSLEDEHTQKYIKERFNNIDENGRRYMKSPIQSPNRRENLIYDYKGYKTPTKGYSVSREVLEQWDKEGKLAFPDDKSKNINRKIYLDEYKGQPISNLWSDIYVINPMSKERTEFDGGQKPEALIKRVFEFATMEGDLILDIFGGSGTTFTTAHKMKRKWIGVELGNHAESLIIPRLKKVLNGKDEGGITESVNWQGGGSFKFYHLGESIINVDEETGKGEFNWKLGKKFIQDSLLQSYDYIPHDEINIFPAQIFKDEENSPSVGKISNGTKATYGVVILASPEDKGVTISNEDVKTILHTLRKQQDFKSLTIYTNKGIDMATEAIPEDLGIIKVPHAIFSELER